MGMKLFGKGKGELTKTTLHGVTSYFITNVVIFFFSYQFIMLTDCIFLVMGLTDLVFEKWHLLQHSFSLSEFVYLVYVVK